MNRTGTRRLRLGMVGGGRDAFIGGVHRIASRIDDHYELVAGAFSSTVEKSRASASDLGLKSAREDGIEVVSIVTPNHLHFEVAAEFLKRGVHVICDKPLTSSLEDARALVEIASASKARFLLTHNYTGYPMVRQAREMIASGQLGSLRLVQMEYAQDWLSTRLEKSGQKQADWRTDPKRSGLGGCIGDIGTHAFNLGSFVSGLSIESLCADIQTFVEGRELDDNAHVMLRFEGGARGMLWSSQVAPGNENALKLRVYGSEGGLEWSQEDPNYLWHTPLGKPKQLLTRSGSGATEAANAVSRIPGGHPEGYLEGFATLYSEFAESIRNSQTSTASTHLPNVNDGLLGVAFVSAVVQSSASGGQWVPLDL